MTPAKRAAADAEMDAKYRRELDEMQAKAEAARLRRERNDPHLRWQAEQEDDRRRMDAEMAEMSEVLAQRRAEAVSREEAMIERLGLLAEFAQQERDEAQERERVAEGRHGDAMRVAWIGAGAGITAAVLAAVAVLVA
jgi:hypothetical protein